MKIEYDDKFAAIIDSVCFWLGYQFKIGRDQLIHEASLRYPIADTITSKGISINRINLEWLHPYFISKKIDLVIVDKVENGTVQEVYEFKIAKSGTSLKNDEEHQRVFNDVIRLAYYHKISKIDCYFLMCGKYFDFKTFFVGQEKDVFKLENEKIVVAQQRIETPVLTTQDPQFDKGWTSRGLYKDWFAFEFNGEQVITFKITNPKSKSEWGLRNFQKSYKIRDKKILNFENTITIKTTCMAITPNGFEKSRTHAAGIWKIEYINKNKLP